MKLPIRNNTAKPLHLFIEIFCDECEIPPGGEAIVTLEDGRPHSIDVYEGGITIWDEGVERAIIEVRSTQKSAGR
jgi:hypothetical protein